MRRPADFELDAELTALDTASIDQLRARWREVYKVEPPLRIRATLLRRAVAYQLQVLVLGGLKPSTQRRLRQIAAELRERRARGLADDGAAAPAPPSQAATLSPGTQLLREWNGTVQTVDVTTDGFLWKGRNFANLSAVAKAITGTKWSGPRFFGLLKSEDPP